MTIADAEQKLQELIDLPCIGAIAQQETGGDLLLHFGGWQLYEDPPDHKVLTSERGRWSLMLSCPWRLDSDTAVIADWRSVGDPARQNELRHLALEGKRVLRVEMSQPGLDLRIQFSHGLRLLALCDSVGKSGDCWYLLFPDDSSIAARRDFRLTLDR